MRTRERLPRWLVLYCAFLIVAAFGLSAMASCTWDEFLHGVPYREGGHELIRRDRGTATTFAADVACSQSWARVWYHDPTITYRDSETEVVAYVKVHGDVIKTTSGDAAETVRGDTVLFVAHLYALEPVILQHGQLHVIQARHPELQPGGDIHYPPLWAACHIPTRFP